MRPARRFLAALACVAGALLSACATPTPRAERAVLREVSAQFFLGGRMSASDGNQGASGRIEWQHDAAGDEVTVYSPLGQIAARLISSPTGAELLTGDGQRYQAENAEALMPRVFGFGVPVSRLAHWVQAAPPPGAEVRELDAAGRPALVIDQGWRVDYLEYPDTRARTLPTRVEVSRGDARIRLIIDQWELLQ